MKWALIDGDQRATESPTWGMPPADQRRRLEVGAVVKLGFELTGGKLKHGLGGERMWVRISEIASAVPRTYVGKLESRPVVIGLKYGAEITFGVEHVIDIEEKNMKNVDTEENLRSPNPPVLVWQRGRLRIVAAEIEDESGEIEDGWVPVLFLERKYLDSMNGEHWKLMCASLDMDDNMVVDMLMAEIATSVNLLPKWVQKLIENRRESPDGEWHGDEGAA